MDATSIIAFLRSAMLETYSQLEPRNETEKASYEGMVTHVTAWFNASNRSITDAAVVCCEKYVTAELDSVTPGYRGLGRMTDNEPRFAAKYRAVFQRQTNAVGLLKPLFTNHLFLGYFFAEFLVETMRGSTLARDPKVICSREELFAQWVPMLYSAAGGASFDKAMEKESGDSRYWGLKELWVNTTLRPIRVVLNELGISQNDKDTLLLCRYFDAGIVLRLLESRPLSETERFDVVTGGGYSAMKAGLVKPAKSGCLVFIAMGAVLAMLVSIAFAR